MPVRISAKNLSTLIHTELFFQSLLLTSWQTQKSMALVTDCVLCSVQYSAVCGLFVKCCYAFNISIWIYPSRSRPTYKDDTKPQG